LTFYSYGPLFHENESGDIIYNPEHSISYIIIEVTDMAFPTPINSQITDAVTKSYTAGGDEALSVISALMTELANCLEGAKQGSTTIEDLSVAFENAEGALHNIVAKLATGKE
jgi:hypothetical protein